MRGRIFIVVIAVLLGACDDTRVFEKYDDFDDKEWPSKQLPEFEFEIGDPALTYNIYCNLRNAEDYPFADFRFTWYLKDTAGVVTDKKLVTEYLFDKKSGQPFGSSGLGDIYDHQFMVLKDQKFPHAGKYRMQFEQFMRRDTLEGILAVGLRVEKVVKE